MNDATRLALMAARASIDAALAADRAEREAAIADCTHPKERRISRGAMGKPNAARCGICGATTEDGEAWVPATREG